MSFRYSSNDLSVVRMSGEVDYNNCREAVSYINQLMGQRKIATCMEMDSLKFIDGRGLIALSIIAAESRRSGIPVKITSLNTHAANILKIAGVWNEFEIPEDVHIKPTEPLCASSTGTLDLDIQPGRNECRLARNSIAAFGYQMGFSEEELDDIRWAIGEALSNAVRHGTPSNESIKIMCQADENQLQIVMQYPSEQFDPNDVPVPSMDLSCESGMGIHFIKLIMDSLDYSFENGLVTVTMTKHRRLADMLN